MGEIRERSTCCLQGTGEMKISIIMPVYNAERYLRSALDSVIAQDYSDWECICVDDGSEDSSGRILDEYARVDSRFVVIHQQNKGEGGARNTALNQLHGDVFTCLDSDDILLPHALKAIDRSFESCECEAVCFNPLFVTFENLSELKDVSASESEPSVLLEDRFELLWGNNGNEGFCSGRVYKVSKFGQVRFPVGIKMCADSWHWLEAIAVDSAWSVVATPIVGYRQVRNSASNTFDAEFNRCILKNFKHTCDVLKRISESVPDAMKRFWRRQGPVIQHHLCLMCRDWRTFSRKDRLELIDQCRQIPEWMGECRLSWNVRIRLWCLHPPFASLLIPCLSMWFDWVMPRVNSRISRFFKREAVCISR